MNKGVIFLIVFLTFASCEKDSMLPEQGKSTLRVIKNDQNYRYKGHARISQNNTIEMAFYSFRSNGTLQEGIVLENVEINDEVHTLHDDFNKTRLFYYTVSTEGDTGEDHYIVDTSITSNYILLHKIDTVIGHVTGEFGAELAVDSIRGKSNPKNPDRVVFTDAKFELVLKP